VFSVRTDVEAAVVNINPPAGYPFADAREWEECKRTYMNMSQDMANELQKPVEIYDEDLCLLEVVFPYE
jgi:hypothetical protein